MIREHSLGPEAGISKRILVVDDSEINRLMAIRLLNKLHFKHVDEAIGGRQALDMLSGTSYDLVLMDLELRGLSGFETTRDIRSGKAGKAAATVPIIAMTCHSQSQAMEECIEGGMNGFLEKPLSLESLQLVLKENLCLSCLGKGGRVSQTDASALLDKQWALNRLDGDEIIYGKLVSLFMQEHPATLQQAREALNSNNIDEVGDVAHKMKSMYRSVGAMSCGGFSDSLETAAREKDFAEVRRFFSNLEHEARRLVSLLGR